MIGDHSLHDETKPYERGKQEGIPSLDAAAADAIAVASEVCGSGADAVSRVFAGCGLDAVS